MSASFGTRAHDEPIPAVAEAATGFDDHGYVLMVADSGATVTKTAAVTDDWVGILVDGTLDATTGAELLGQPVSYQASGVVPVKVVAGTYRHMDKIYVAQTASPDGHASADSANAAVLLGRFVGEDNTVVAEGEHIEVLLGRA